VSLQAQHSWVRRKKGRREERFVGEGGKSISMEGAGCCRRGGLCAKNSAVFRASQLRLQHSVAGSVGSASGKYDLSEQCLTRSAFTALVRTLRVHGRYWPHDGAD
jgi:phage protein U